MKAAELPPGVAQFAQQLSEAGFDQVASENGTMDSGHILFRRGPLAVSVWKDRSQWSLDVMVDGWRDSMSFPLLGGYGRPGSTGDPFAPRRSRDRAADYDVPDAVRWLIRQLLSAGLADKSSLDEQRCLVFQREPVTVRLDRDSRGWSVHLCVEGSGPDAWITLPRFEGFAES